MMHVFINALGASAGGGLTYLRNVLPRMGQAVRVTAAVSEGFHIGAEQYGNIAVAHVPSHRNVLHRFWFEQKQLPKIIRKSGADILVSTGNFAVRQSPVRQILLSRNSLYVSREFFRDLAARGEYRIWCDTRIKAALAKRSVRWADCTVAPSESFAGELRKWTGNPVLALHHGFDRDHFSSNADGLAENVIAKLESPPETVRVLLVSHYNYYRNFETVLRAVARLRDLGEAPSMRLFLTCDLQKEKTPGGYDPARAAHLIERLGIHEQVVELGAIPYEHLHELYRACDVYVTAAYAETFAHPLVEAMSCKLPVVASDLPVHREICGDAAAYFPCFSENELAAQLNRLAMSRDLRHSMASTGLQRSLDFSWNVHVDRLLAVAEELVGRKTCASSRSMTAA
jgi:glycosyltransferase involved in cell wall biosynthesis